ncbi:hypothetical protein C7974DRAFT_458396, partial [Boeremia exigua]|uniref:uncharacterized protein n=1 Tax=Boeremia exigua TaxID=749465 RepID=UPI001E8DA120
VAHASAALCAWRCCCCCCPARRRRCPIRGDCPVRRACAVRTTSAGSTHPHLSNTQQQQPSGPARRRHCIVILRLHRRSILEVANGRPETATCPFTTSLARAADRACSNAAGRRRPACGFAQRVDRGRGSRVACHCRMRSLLARRLALASGMRLLITVSPRRACRTVRADDMIVF